MFLPAQLWKYENTKLKNKNGAWIYGAKTWTLPQEGVVGPIEDTASGEVLTIKKDGNEVILEVKEQPITEEQGWLRGTTIMNGHFTLKNQASGNFLTGVTSDSAIHAGNNIPNT